MSRGRRSGLAAPDESGPDTAARLVLAGTMVAAGVLHFVVPGIYDRLIPRILGAPRFWTLSSGVAEATAGLLLAVPRTRHLGAWLLAAVLVAVLPANVLPALRGGYDLPGVAGSATVAWLRLPLQALLIAWALRYRRPVPGVDRARRPEG